MQQTQVNYKSGIVEYLRTVGLESPELRKQFQVNRDAILQRLESNEIKSAEIKETHNIGRNDPCPCGSKLKFKKCCGKRLAVDDDRVKE